MYHVFDIIKYYKKSIMVVLDHTKNSTCAHFLQVHCIASRIMPRISARVNVGAKS